MIKRMVLMLVAVGLVFGGIFGFEAFRSSMIKKFMSSMGAPPQTVATGKVEWQDWQTRLQAVGSLRAAKGADLALEVGGLVDAIAFNSGDEVAAGTVLLRLRADDDIAHLRALEATAELANVTLQRDQRQLLAQAVSQATIDTDAANLKNVRAQVAQQQATIDKKTLRAPFAGRLGLRAVDVGQYLTAGTAVVTLQSLDPIYADFHLPQQALAQVKIGQLVSVRVDTWPDQSFQGFIEAIDPKVDTTTRNVMVRAKLANPDHTLLPGMFARVEIDTSAPVRQLTLPQTAIAHSPYGDTIYVVDQKGVDAKGQPQLVARQTFVTTGPTRGDQIAVLKGLKEGDTVVIAGQNKLRNGTVVLVDNTVKPSDDAHPTPADN